MRSLLFVSPHFPPDSAAGTHRARILAPHLAACGWRPTVLTVDEESIEGDLDEELAASVDSGLRTVRVSAWPHRWTRRIGFGDLGIRAYRPLRRMAMQLARAEKFDATLVTTYPTYPALIGGALKHAFGMPFVLDLQDPWVGAWGKDVGPGGNPDIRSRASRALATRLEAHAASADALMSVTTRTMQDLVSRVPSMAALPQLEVPIGWEPADWARVRVDGVANPLFDPKDGQTHLCAVGTLLPTAIDGLRAFLEGVSMVVADPAAGRRLKVWFVGTSNERRADAPGVVAPMALAAGVGDIVVEHPPRLAYFEALRVLRDAHAVLVLGSAEPHYTPSRVFPALASRRPIIARLHRESPAWHLLAVAAQSRPVMLIPSDGGTAAEAPAFAQALASVRDASSHDAPQDDAALAAFSGRVLASRVGALLDKVSLR